MDNIFKTIKQKSIERLEYRKKVLTQNNVISNKEQSRESRLKEIKALSLEFYGLFQDEKYPLYTSYLKKVSDEYKQIMLDTTLCGGNATASAACIKLIETILDYPIAIVKEFEDAKKEIE
ncbi:MAG: hypothetical protein FP827_06680 [Candidatus Omnitrophica bacterium]|nr:hypothetical protein [Candidatus Omnitrophota bacterium]